MQTKIEVTKTYWVGMTQEQKEHLTKFVTEFNCCDRLDLEKFDFDGLEAIDDLRQVLINA